MLHGGWSTPLLTFCLHLQYQIKFTNAHQCQQIRQYLFIYVGCRTYRYLGCFMQNSDANKFPSRWRKRNRIAGSNELACARAVYPQVSANCCRLE